MSAQAVVGLIQNAAPLMKALSGALGGASGAVGGLDGAMDLAALLGGGDLSALLKGADSLAGLTSLLGSGSTAGVVGTLVEGVLANPEVIDLAMSALGKATANPKLTFANAHTPVAPSKAMKDTAKCLLANEAAVETSRRDGTLDLKAVQGSFVHACGSFDILPSDGGGYAGKLPVAGRPSAGGSPRSVPSLNENIHGNQQQLGDTILKLSSGGPDTAMGRLAQPATFEDLMAAFMIDEVVNQQDKIKEKMDQLRAIDDKLNAAAAQKEAENGSTAGATPATGTGPATGSTPGRAPTVGRAAPPSQTPSAGVPFETAADRAGGFGGPGWASRKAGQGKPSMSDKTRYGGPEMTRLVQDAILRDAFDGSVYMTDAQADKLEKMAPEDAIKYLDELRKDEGGALASLKTQNPEKYAAVMEVRHGAQEQNKVDAAARKDRAAARRAARKAEADRPFFEKAVDLAAAVSKYTPAGAIINSTELGRNLRDGVADALKAASRGEKSGLQKLSVMMLLMPPPVVLMAPSVLLWGTILGKDTPDASAGAPGVQGSSVSGGAPGNDGARGTDGAAGEVSGEGGATAGATEGATGGDKETLERSRTILFEEMKASMNKLQQMQTALSDVLKAMHDTAMSSIRNIK